MDEFTPLVRPQQAQVQIDPTPKECPSDGFSYPSFRLINKQARVKLSNHLNPQPTSAYRLFAVANSQGWFAAAKSNDSYSELIFSPLADLRSAFAAAKEESNDIYVPKRSLILSQGKPNIITFAHGGTRLLVGIDDGSILVYDTAALFSPGTEDIAPLHTSLSTSGPVRQVSPNPGAEQNLADLVAVVRGDGTVQLVNTQLENKGGWIASHSSAIPVAVSWSPKGKHLAIGLQTGDLLTFALSNQSTPNKHIPPTADAFLVSLSWTGPGHTFRTTYAPKDPDTGDPVHHIITLDTKSSTATYVAPSHPFTLSERPQTGYEIVLPRWDSEPGQTTGDKVLFVIGDTSSVDLEVIGNAGNQWYEQSQENPVTLPLDKNMDDTMLLSLDVDLTDLATSEPIVYAYLNDGTLQGWHIDYSKPYIGMVTPGAAEAQVYQPMPTQTSTLEQKPPASVFGQPSVPPQQPPATSAFGQPAFGQPSPFGQSAFGQQPTSAFAQQPQSTSSFGSNTSSMGGFGAYSGGTSAFGSLSSTQSNPGTSTFGGGSPQSSSTSVFGGGGSSGFGSSSGAFGGLSSSGSTNAFGTGTFWGGNTTTTPLEVPAVTREASMQDSTSSFEGLGGLSLGGGGNSDSDSKSGGIFGSFSTTPAATTTPISAFGGVVKPAVGFGAFSNLQTSQSPSSSTTSEPATPASAPGSSTASPAFGQSGFGAKSAFGQPAFGQSAFGQSAFGQTGFGKPTPAATAAPATGGFGAYASTTPTLSSGGGFGAFASSSPASFGTSPKTASTDVASSANAGAPEQAKPASTSSSVVNTPPAPSPAVGSASIFTGSSSPNSLPFGSARTGSPFGSKATNASATMSPPSSPEPDNFRSASPANDSPPTAHAFKSTTPTPTTGAFSNLQSTPSAFKPASGFGAFGNVSSSSPFLKKPEHQAPVSVFASHGSTPPSGSTTPSSSPAFGTPSALGGNKSVFAPPTPPSPTPSKAPTTGGFGAFSGSTSGFGAFAGSKKSFSDLLKGNDDSKDPVKSSITTHSQKPDKKTEAKPEPVSVFGSPSTPRPETPTAKEGIQTPVSTKLDEEQKPFAKTPVEVKTPIVKTGSSGTLSDELVDISTSSTGSSFVEVSGEISADGSFDEPPADEYDEEENNEDDDFLSDDVGSHGSSDISDDEESGSEYQPSRLASPVAEATAIPLPASRSPSATPQPDVPKIEITPSPSPSEQASTSSASTERETSTTPPGTPTKEVKLVFTKPPATMPTTTSSAPVTPSPFNLGLGRPSTRPTRSSPLASAPVSGDDEDEAGERGQGEANRIAQVPTIKPPISPKPVFGVLPSKVDIPVKAESTEENTSPTAKRPKTPPLLSSFGGSKPPAIPSTPVLAHAVPPGQRPATTPATSSAKLPPPPTLPPSFNVPSLAPETIIPPAPSSSASIFGKQAEISRPATTPALTSLFGTPPAPGAPPISPPAPSSFFSMPQFNLKGPGVPSVPTGSWNALDKGKGQTTDLPTAPLDQPVSAPQSLESSTLDKSKGRTMGFSPLDKSMSASQSLESNALDKGKVRTLEFPPAPLGKSTSAPPSTMFGQPPITLAPVPPPEATMEEGMQKECALLVLTLNRELENLRLLAQQANARHADLKKPTGGSRKKADLSDPSKWALSDAIQFGQVLKEYVQDLNELKENREKERQAIRDLQSQMIKAGTRREEIARFNKAKTDTGFAKMLKSRTLGPEHLETQTQLRRSIQAMRDRIQQLEANLQASKKKLAQATSGKAGLRAPSLDTINRTYRNIDIAIQQQASDVAQLAARIANLNISAIADTSNGRDARLPDVVSRRPYNITPHVAVTTAAALNAERSAQRLKRSLLSVRREPLLNNKVALAPPAPMLFSTPQKPGGSTAFGFQTSLSSDRLFPIASSSQTPETPSPNWTLPPGDDFSPTAWTPTQRRGAGSGQKKHSSVALKRGPGTSPTPAPSAFDWGPLPQFNNAPLNALAAGVKITPQTTPK